MDKNIRKEYRKFIMSVCNDKNLIEFSNQFFDDFCKHYESKTFTRQDFEEMKINKQLVEQDVAKDLFADKETATPEEVLLYLMKHNVKKISFDKVMKNATGEYNYEQQVVAINDAPIALYQGGAVVKNIEQVKPVTRASRRPVNFVAGWKQKYEEKKKEKDFYINENVRRLKAIKDSLYHELSHVFEVKTYQDRKFVTLGFEDKILFHGELFNQNKKVYLDSRVRNITDKTIRYAMMRKKRSVYHDERNAAEVMMVHFASLGSSAISEIYNEEFSRRIGNTIEKESQPKKSWFDPRYCRKENLTGTCYYNLDYDVLKLLNLTVGEDSIDKNRFNNKDFIERFNSLNIPEEKLLQLRENAVNTYLEKVNGFDLNEPIFKTIKDTMMRRLSQKGLFYTLSVLMGMAADTRDIRYVKEHFSTGYKLAVQDLFIEGIKNQILADLENPDVIKDRQFFKALNEKLITIDNSLFYPNRLLKTFKRGKEYGSLETVVVPAMENMPLSNFAKHNKECVNIKTFVELLDVIEEKMQWDYKEFSDEMTFMDGQEKLRRNLLNIKKEDSRAIIERKIYFLKLCQEAENINNSEDEKDIQKEEGKQKQNEMETAKSCDATNEDENDKVN